jgi:MYXO-CTERM domain-containing protein
MKGIGRSLMIALWCGASLVDINTACADTISGQVLYELTLPRGINNPLFTDTVGGQVDAIGNFGVPTGVNQALLWNDTSTAVNLTPPGRTESAVGDISGGQELGEADGQATLWSGTAASAMDLNPPGFTVSNAAGIDGSEITGDGYGKTTDENDHALLWTGAAGNVVDLNPPGLVESAAFGIDDGQEVGAGGPGFVNGLENQDHALLWTGTAASVVDLNPQGFLNSRARNTDGKQQVGDGTDSSGGDHALLWSGTAASAVELNPAGFNLSFAIGVCGGQQVGYGMPTGSDNVALLWDGTAASAVDLQTHLPNTGSWASSGAFSIDASGNIYGVAYGTYDGISGYYAVEWSQADVPEPTALGLAAMALAFVRRRR